MKRESLHKFLHLLYGLCFLALLLLALLRYNSLGSSALLAAGWILILLGSCLAFLSTKARRRGALAEEGIEEQQLVTEGPYGVIRHPEFLSHMIIGAGLSLLSQHWLSLLFLLLIGFMAWIAAKEEENENLKKFGVSYRRYLHEVPAFNFISGLYRYLRRRRSNVF